MPDGGRATSGKEPTRAERLKRELVVELGGRFCKWPEADSECEGCEYHFAGHDLVFHDAMHECPDEGSYRCVDCFIAHALTSNTFTRSTSEHIEHEARGGWRSLDIASPVCPCPAIHGWAVADAFRSVFA